MLILISPAKTLDFSPIDNTEHTLPRLTDETTRLVKLMKKKSPRVIKKLMSVSDKIAELNYERFQQFEPHFSLENSKQAMYAFRGDVYLGLESESFSDQEAMFAQKHLRILSGFYGLLRPLDLMQPYRLEMGLKLKIGARKNLYEFWGKKITNLVNDDLKEQATQSIINLASIEYFKSIKKNLIKGDIITVHFKENRNGVYKVIGFNAKKARGGMAKQIIQNQIDHPSHIKDLVVDDYAFNAEMSTDQDYYFTK